MIIGANGLIGSFLVDFFMYINLYKSQNIYIIAVGRNDIKMKERFEAYSSDKRFSYMIADINNGFHCDKNADYVFHLASNTHPLAYANYPIETLMTNVNGTYSLLKYAQKHAIQRFIFASSVEVYGNIQNKEIRPFSEKDFGYIDCNTVRACYNEGKRAGEALCQAFIAQYGLDIVIPRLCRVYGPTMKLDDSKALSQFFKNGLKKEDIVLKSLGNQFFSYLYVGDVVSALLYILLKGKKGEAYNIADSKSNVTLKELAEFVAKIANTKVVFDIPDFNESLGYSKATYAIMNSDKLKKLGWNSYYGIEEGIVETFNILEKKIPFTK